MATRTSTKTQTASAIPEIELPETEFSSFEFFKAMAEMGGVEIPTGRQVLVGFAVAFITGFAGAYATSSLASYVAVGALILSGSAFLSLLAMVLTYVIGIYLTLKVSSRVATWVASGTISEDAASAKTWLSDKFSSMKARLAPAPEAA